MQVTLDSRGECVLQCKAAAALPLLGVLCCVCVLQLHSVLKQQQQQQQQQLAGSFFCSWR
jgi:hypothetical protein